MNWREWVSARLGELDAAQLRRHTDVLDPALVDFSSNDYLGLSRHPQVIAAAREALETYGLGPRGSPLICGYTEKHAALEQDLATLKHADCALLFPTGFAANLGVLSALSGPDTTVFSDELNHASIIDGCRIARRNGARVVIYPHADVDALDDALRADSGQRRLIVTDSVFSMDGDLAPLADIVDVAERHGASVAIDEAHATLVFGDEGGGVAELQGVAERIQLHIGTLSKAFGTQGGFVACTPEMRHLLLNRARSYVYSTALPVPIVAAARAALRVAAGGELRRRLFGHVRRVGATLDLAAAGPIIPIVLGSEQHAIAAASALEDAGLHAPAIRPPTVPEGTSRLRVALSACHTDEEIDRLLNALGRLSG